MAKLVMLLVTFEDDIPQEEAEKRIEDAFAWAEIAPTWDKLEIIHTASSFAVSSGKQI